MTVAQAKQFFLRIDSLAIDEKPLFGLMNSHQMICHCSDFFRMAKGSKKAEEYGVTSLDDIKKLKKEGKSISTPKGFGQVEGKGTKPVDFEDDKEILKGFILEFTKLPEDFNFAAHPIFGKMDAARWSGLAMYHLDHHLKQFAV